MHRAQTHTLARTHHAALKLHAVITCVLCFFARELELSLRGQCSELDNEFVRFDQRTYGPCFNTFDRDVVYLQAPPIPDAPFDKFIHMLQDDHWRHVRNSVSPAFTTGKLRKVRASCIVGNIFHVQSTFSLKIESARACQMPIGLIICAVVVSV